MPRSTGPQNALFEVPSPIAPADPGDALRELAHRLPQGLRLGTSSWSFAGWAGLVWARAWPDAVLAREGLPAYAAHPLLRTVSVDRSFHRAMQAAEFAAMAAQAPADFRFLVKAPAAVSDAAQRDDHGLPTALNPGFLDPTLALELALRPALDGLGPALGVLVFQISPLPVSELARIDTHLARLDAMLAACRQLLDQRAPHTPHAPHASAPAPVLAVEPRDPVWLQPALAELLVRHHAVPVVAGHPRMGPVAAQLPLLRQVWRLGDPCPLVARWNLHARHGATGYRSAKAGYAPFDQMVDPDLDTRHALADLAAAVLGRGQPVWITINNKAEGCAPRSVFALAEAIAGRLPPAAD